MNERSHVLEVTGLGKEFHRRGGLFRRDGTLVASVAQEGLIRLRPERA